MNETIRRMLVQLGVKEQNICDIVGNSLELTGSDKDKDATKVLVIPNAPERKIYCTSCAHYSPYNDGYYCVRTNMWYGRKEVKH